MLRIKEVIKSRKTTAKELAAKIGISEGALSLAINGNPTAETLEKIASALGVSPADLFERRGDFIAFVRLNGETHTFESAGALKAFADTLPTSEQ